MTINNSVINQFVYFLEYVLSTVDKIINWARQGSIWSMVNNFFFVTFVTI